MTVPEVLSLFPRNTSLNHAGGIAIGGCDLTAIADEFGTPTLVVDESSLRARAREYVDGLQSRWPDSMVVWASKSFPCTAIYRVLASEGVAIDVAGGGELAMALAAGVDPARIVLHGNAKTDEEIGAAVSAGVGCIVVDNFDDITRLARATEASTGRVQRVLVRIIPGVRPDTHAAVSTGQDDSKFGLSMADAQLAMARIREVPTLGLDGIHLHIGSQILATEPFAESVDAVRQFEPFAVYDLGGGLGARYTYSDHPPTIDAYLDALVGAARELLPAGARIMIEPGRSMVAESGVSLYRIVTVKRSDGRTFVAVDGGMGDNLEVSLYQQRFEATLVERVGGSDPCTVVGRHCESGDQLIDSVPLADPQVGDLLAVPVTGAYTYSLSNNYNGARRPPVVFVRDGHARAVVRRETYDDLMRRDLPW